MNKSLSSVPRHLGLIIDGNRRWAKAHGRPTLEGHRVGYANLKTIVMNAFDRGVEYVSAYTFSSENWQRTKAEVKYLMDLAMVVFTKDLDELNKRGIKVLVAGSRQRLSAKLIKAIEVAEQKTYHNQKGTLVLCFNYGGQQEIADAANDLIQTGAKQITASDIEQNLYVPEAPPLDFVIRTGGEQRLSNFMLWRVAYAELLFVDKQWPDFAEADLDTALADYASRQRRFGK